MGSLEIDVSEVRKLVELVERHGLEELTVQEADLSITVKSRVAAPAPPQPAAVQVIETAPPAETEYQPADAVAEPAVAQDRNIVDILAPLVGVFYHAPAPDAPPFVEVGDTIEVGSEVGLIEAMKVFSSIPSEVAGVVVAIPAQNGKLVYEGDTLIRVRIEEHPEQ